MASTLGVRKLVVKRASAHMVTAESTKRTSGGTKMKRGVLTAAMTD
jgi:hypothetical protein